MERQRHAAGWAHDRVGLNRRAAGGADWLAADRTGIDAARQIGAAVGAAARQIKPAGRAGLGCGRHAGLTARAGVARDGQRRAAACTDVFAFEDDRQTVRAERHAARRARPRRRVEGLAAARAAGVADGRRQIGSIKQIVGSGCFFSGQGVVTCRAGDRRAEDHLVAEGTRAREEPIAVRALRRRGQEFLPAVGAVERQDELARATAGVRFGRRRAAARAKRAAARAAHAVEARHARPAVGTVFGIGLAPGFASKGRAAGRAARRLRRNFLAASRAGQNEDGAACGAGHRIGVERRAAGGTAFAAAGRTHAEVFGHGLPAVRARLFLEENGLAMRAARIAD